MSFLCFDFQMKRLNSSPSKNFTVSVYWQVFGQEVLYFDISRESLGDIKHVRE